MVPAEHGGWGLTFEAVLLGLLVRPSGAGAAVGGAALLAFVARTPLKLAGVDHRRHRRLDRTVLAERVAAAELSLLSVAVALAVLYGRGWWWVPLAAAIPFFGLELSFDVRSRGRRLTPELSGAVGMGAVAAAAIGSAGGLEARLAVGLWVVLASRAVAAVPFARTQVRRLKSQPDQRRVADSAQMATVVVVLAGWAIGLLAWPAVIAVAGLAVWNAAAMRCRVRSAEQIGVSQMLAGLVVVAAAATGVLVGA